jgi:hypothetical protein
MRESEKQELHRIALKNLPRELAGATIPLRGDGIHY